MLKNLKKVISTIAAVAILATSASAFAVTFPDVDASAGYASDVELLVALGVVNGDDNGKFNPDNTVTRAEFAKMVVEALGKGDAAASSSYTRFADAQGHWAAGYIEAGVAAEFINGYDENTFGPDDTVTYAQAIKMLVGAAGYESWAQMAGGWKAGYMSYGSTLGIMKGVTGVAEDTALTRAQCATLIANAMKAPLLVINGYLYEGTMNGVVQVPNYQQMNGENGRDWKSMLTEYHNAYDVYGRVVDTAKITSSMEAGTVKFDVEKAERFEDTHDVKAYMSNGNKTGYQQVTAYAGDTNASDMMMEYASAVIVKDEDTDKYTIASIKPYGASEKLEVAAALVRDVANSKINVYKSEMTSDVDDYDLDAQVALYVNGFAANIANVANYIGQVNNRAGVVTLIDTTDAASTSTDGDYDIISISYTMSDIVENTKVTSTLNRITMETNGTLTYDPEDEKTSVVFMLDGEEIAFEDLKEDDVLTITKDPNASLLNLKSAVVEVTRETVAGTVSNVRLSEDVVVVDGTEYDIASALINGNNPAVQTTKEYTFFMDANGVIIKAEPIAANINYGVITRFYMNDNDKYVVNVITAEGKEVSYELKAGEETAVATKLGCAAPTRNNKVTWSWDDITSVNNQNHAANLQAATVAYKLSDGKLKLDTNPAVENVTAGTSVEYKASTSKLGTYVYVSDATSKVLDLSMYLQNKEYAPEVMTVDMFEDENNYTAFAFDKNNIGDKAYQFVIITDGRQNLRPTSDLAIVQKVNGTGVAADGTDIDMYTVVKNGETVELNIEQALNTSLNEGAVIMYPASGKGYIQYADVETIFDVKAITNNTFAGMFGMATANGEVFDHFDVVNNVDNAYLVANAYQVPGTNEYYNSLTVDGRTDADVAMYMGILTSATTNQINFVETVNNNQSTVDSATTLSIDGANVYTYNFKITKDNFRVEADMAATMGAGELNIITTEVGNIEYINWAQAINPNEIYAPIVLVREVDGDVTDVFYFINE